MIWFNNFFAHLLGDVEHMNDMNHILPLNYTRGRPTFFVTYKKNSWCLFTAQTLMGKLPLAETSWVTERQKILQKSDITVWTIISLVGNGLELMEQLMELCARKDMNKSNGFWEREKIHKFRGLSNIYRYVFYSIFLTAQSFGIG